MLFVLFLFCIFPGPAQAVFRQYQSIVVKYSVLFLKMFSKKLLFMCLIFSIHADDRDYAAELSAEANSGEGLSG